MDHVDSTPSMFINSLCTGVLILFAKLIEAYQNIHLPPIIIIETLQALSYAGAIVVSCFTIYNYCKKKTKK